MQLIDQHTKKIMEECKERALSAGLNFDPDTLEYLVSNTDMLELSPKNMIPTLYDYWLQDIQVLRGKGEYEVYPNNPYETVINTRPVISFYNDTNPDWLNVMIFYHVLAHIDFFQNNKLFEKTWDYDFKQKSLSEKRMIAKLRSQKGRIVDYVIEFAKGIDNLVGYHDNLKNADDFEGFNLSPKIDFYFNVFLPNIKKLSLNKILVEIEKFNQLSEKGDFAEKEFFKSILKKNPEVDDLYIKHIQNTKRQKSSDIIEFITNESEFLNKAENKWMKSVIQIIRETSMYFAPMIRSKIMNEGWASYWHEKLFLADERIKGHEVAFAKINAKVTSISKVGLNPYAIGWRLFMFIEEQANKGKLTYDYYRLHDQKIRKQYDKKLASGRDFIFHVRENYSDFTFLRSFINQEFIDNYKLMVVGQRINQQKNTREFFIKSKKAEDYKNMIIESLFHPPYLKYEKKNDGTLYITHNFEGKELFRDYVQNTIIGIEYLWGNKVQLETTEINWDKYKELVNENPGKEISINKDITQKVLYTVRERKVSKIKIAA